MQVTVIVSEYEPSRKNKKAGNSLVWVWPALTKVTYSRIKKRFKNRKKRMK